MAVLGLPPVPAELKSVAPYLQRAEEVKAQDPVISYWCAYYAAQLGVALKLRDHASRVFLMDLLGLLEQIKADIGPNDAIEDDAASAAYVENFALRVFQLADNEDRRGAATRATAKKFLAAANFLEVLTTFAASASADATTTVDVPEKIRYAKWKAVDIARALQEGRKPAPGGIDERQPDEPAAAPAADEDPASAPVAPAAGAPASTRAWVSPELEGREDEYDQGGSAPPLEEPDAYVHVSSEIPSAPMGGGEPHEGGEGEELSTHGVHDFAQPSPSAPAFALPSVPSEPSLPSVPSAPFDPSAPLGPPPSAPTFPPAPPTPPPLSPPRLPPPSLPPPPRNIPPQPPTAPHVSRPAPAPIRAPARVPPPPIEEPEPEPAPELAPATVAKIQRHCKFAISALDYEDADTARKELRLALQMLGG